MPLARMRFKFDRVTLPDGKLGYKFMGYRNVLSAFDLPEGYLFKANPCIWSNPDSASIMIRTGVSMFKYKKGDLLTQEAYTIFSRLVNEAGNILGEFRLHEKRGGTWKGRHVLEV